MDYCKINSDVKCVHGMNLHIRKNTEWQGCQKNEVKKPLGEFSRQCFFSESPMSGEYFGRLIASGECGVCLLSSCKVRYPKKKIFKG